MARDYGKIALEYLKGSRLILRWCSDLRLGHKKTEPVRGVNAMSLDKLHVLSP